MRKVKLLILILAINLNTYSQNISGKYTENKDFIEFKNDTVDFEFGGNGGLTMDLHGNGRYKKNDGFLIIETFDYKGAVSHYQKIKSKDGSNHFTILDTNNDAIIGVIITLIDTRGKFLSGTVTDDNGQATLIENDNADKISFSSIGYDSYSIDYSDGFDYKVNLMNYETIENRMVIFKINSINSDTLNLTLLSTNFSGDTNSNTDLKKLERKSDKLKFRNRQLIKQ